MKPIEALENGYIKMKPDNGKIFVCEIDGRQYSEVVCRPADAPLYTEKVR
jgi:hypothetical protein